MADPAQRTDFAGLAEQERILLLFYDDHPRHRLSKAMPNRGSDLIPAILDAADRLAAAIPAAAYDVDQAKVDVVRVTRL